MGVGTSISCTVPCLDHTFTVHSLIEEVFGNTVVAITRQEYESEANANASDSDVSDLKLSSGNRKYKSTTAPGSSCRLRATRKRRPKFSCESDSGLQILNSDGSRRQL